MGRYCSDAQTWDWLRFEGGWWKVPLLAAIAAFAIWAHIRKRTPRRRKTTTRRAPDFPADASYITCASHSISGSASFSKSTYGIRTASVCDPALNTISGCSAMRESTYTGTP